MGDEDSCMGGIMRIETVSRQHRWPKERYFVTTIAGSARSDWPRSSRTWRAARDRLGMRGDTGC